MNHVLPGNTQQESEMLTSLPADSLIAVRGWLEIHMGWPEVNGVLYPTVGQKTGKRPLHKTQLSPLFIIQTLLPMKNLTPFIYPEGGG